MVTEASFHRYGNRTLILTSPQSFVKHNNSTVEYVTVRSMTEGRREDSRADKKKSMEAVSRLRFPIVQLLFERGRTGSGGHLSLNVPLKGSSTNNNNKKTPGNITRITSVSRFELGDLNQQPLQREAFHWRCPSVERAFGLIWSSGACRTTPPPTTSLMYVYVYEMQTMCVSYVCVCVCLGAACV